jgi:hypothetical protein
MAVSTLAKPAAKPAVLRKPVGKLTESVEKGLEGPYKTWHGGHCATDT